MRRIVLTRKCESVKFEVVEANGDREFIREVRLLPDVDYTLEADREAIKRGIDATETIHCYKPCIIKGNQNEKN